MLNKLYPICLMIFWSQVTLADIDVCLRDADTHGHHKHPLSPLPECQEIINSLPNKIDETSPSGMIKTLGIEKMIYVNTGGNIELLAGDQTYLKNISFVNIDEKERKIIVYQEDTEASSVMVFSADFIGNVSPLTMDISEENNHLSHISLLPESDEIALVSSSQKKITFINSDSDHRYQNDGDKWKRKVKRVLTEDSGLTFPSLVTESKNNKELYVLDNNRILIFDLSKKNLDAPEKIIPTVSLNKVTHIGLNEDHTKLILHNKTTLIGEYNLE